MEEPGSPIPRRRVFIRGGFGGAWPLQLTFAMALVALSDPLAHALEDDDGDDAARLLLVGRKGGPVSNHQRIQP